MQVSAEGAKCAGCPEATEEELLAQLDDVLKEYANVPGALIPVLQIAQAIFGYLPEEALKKIALTLDKPYSEVAGVDLVFENNQLGVEVGSGHWLGLGWLCGKEPLGHEQGRAHYADRGCHRLPRQ